MTDTPEKNDTPQAPRPEDATTPTAAASDGETGQASPPTNNGSAPPPPEEPTVPAVSGPPASPPALATEAAAGMKEAPLMEHLIELRSRLVRCLIAVGIGFAGCYAFAEQLLFLLLKPLKDVLPNGRTLIATSLPESFFTVMKLALVAGAFVASPFIFYQLWKFVAPGLYKQERKIIIPVAIASAFCFVGGALFGYFIVFPFGFKFFVDYASDYITVMPTISAYFSLATTLLFAFGLIFELPVFIFFLTSLGLVSTKALRKFRRWAILLSFIVAAVLTPTPDAINQLLMAGPMVVLYEVGIWVSWFVDKSRKEEKAKKAQAEAEAAATPPNPEPEAQTAATETEPAATQTPPESPKSDSDPKAG